MTNRGTETEGHDRRVVVDTHDLLEACGFDGNGVPSKEELNARVEAQLRTVQRLYEESNGVVASAGAMPRDTDGDDDPRRGRTAMPETLVNGDEPKDGTLHVQEVVTEELRVRDRAKAKVLRVQAKDVEAARRARKRQRRIEHSKARRQRPDERRQRDRAAAIANTTSLRETGAEGTGQRTTRAACSARQGAAPGKRLLCVRRAEERWRRHDDELRGGGSDGFHATKCEASLDQARDSLEAREAVRVQQQERVRTLVRQGDRRRATTRARGTVTGGASPDRRLTADGECAGARRAAGDQVGHGGPIQRGGRGVAVAGQAPEQATSRRLRGRLHWCGVEGVGGVALPVPHAVRPEHACRRADGAGRVVRVLAGGGLDAAARRQN
ncbi:hypothetical protein PHYSODRAFT_534064 [Phytophthora sojae]|uniref:Uncharacterized protein n=1 Tax=Phytophthora sojae (strain P6497) TaxID=1094619 RepID=G5AG97_PHYSP|nr:hypothetical protein PHYSODRAFT_534064 [Phytophthora sojae]EGZ05609.1 hypothetical protein PHYSODRAFT_534064 [Phytophthora sojae]|eukprot:XP_009539140.1 hypothetical protein PHYSODRAFT_534064 [Phytophthora sojae]